MYGLSDFPGGRVLIRTSKGLWVTRDIHGRTVIEPVGPAGTRGIFVVRNSPNGDMFMWTDDALFRTTTACRAGRD
jgi:hypothetical protein